MYILSRVSKRLRIFLWVAAGLLVALLLVDVTGFGKNTLPVSVDVADSDAARIDFLSLYGWRVNPTPIEIQTVTLPEPFDKVYQKYNALQKSQGFDLKPFRGKTVTRFTYEILNYPKETPGVRANLLVYEGQIIGGDICTVALDGFMHGFSAEETGVMVPMLTTRATI